MPHPVDRFFVYLCPRLLHIQQWEARVVLGAVQKTSHSLHPHGTDNLGSL